jgi:hypothetical protein
MSAIPQASADDAIPAYLTVGAHEVHMLPLADQLRRMWSETEFPDEDTK